MLLTQIPSIIFPIVFFRSQNLEFHPMPFKTFRFNWFSPLRRSLDVWRDILSHRAVRPRHQCIHVHVNAHVDRHRPVLRYNIPVPAQDDRVDNGPDNRHHMDILVGGHTAVRYLHGQQGNLGQRLLRGNVATRIVQKG